MTTIGIEEAYWHYLFIVIDCVEAYYSETCGIILVSLERRYCPQCQCDDPSEAVLLLERNISVVMTAYY